MINQNLTKFLLFTPFFTLFFTIGLVYNPLFAEQSSNPETVKALTNNNSKKDTDKPAVKGGDFSLIGKNGWVNLSDFRGKVVALYFGYTQCPDVCPTSLSLLSSAIAQLTAKEKKHFQSIFISVDPGRDTVDVLADYVRYFDKDMLGLSAAPDDLDPVVAQYGAYYEKVPYSNSALMYGIDHTSETYIIGKDGKLFAVLPHETDSKTIIKMIRAAMKETGYKKEKR